MNDITIKERLIIIVGPTSVGKTTLANQIAGCCNSTVVSHDEISEGINEKNPERRDFKFRLELLKQIGTALQNRKHVVCDTVNITSQALSAFLTLINVFMTSDILLLKLDVPINRHLENAKKHYRNVKGVKKLTLKQRQAYHGENGSLKTNFRDLVKREYIIDPMDVSFTFI